MLGVCLGYYDYNVGYASYQVGCNIKCILLCLAGKLRGILPFILFYIFPVNVGNACLKFWSKLPWCSQRWDKLFDERNHIQEKSYERKADSLFTWRSKKLHMNWDYTIFSPGWFGKNNLHGWKRKVVSL